MYLPVFGSYIVTRRLVLLSGNSTADGWRRALLAEVRIVRHVAGRGEPDAALPVDHRVVVVGLAVPDVLLAPIGRGPEDLDRAGVAGPERQRHVGRGRQHEVRRHVLDRIEDRHVVAGVLALPVQRPVAVDGRIAPVGRDQIVQILLGVVPVAQRDDDVALDALRPRRLGKRQLALRDALGPVAEILERHAAELTGGDGDHVLAGLAGLDAAHPGLFVGLDRVHVELRDRAGRELAELVAADAAVVLHAVEIVGDLDVGRRVLAAEDLGLRDLHHRVPVDRRVVLRGFRLVRRRHRGQIELLAGLALHLRRVDEAVAAHPDVVIGLRQIGDDVAALVVGDDDLDVAHRQIARFRDHPDAGLGTAGAFARRRRCRRCRWPPPERPPAARRPTAAAIVIRAANAAAIPTECGHPMVRPPWRVVHGSRMAAARRS